MDSGVTGSTSDVFLESAYFNPVSIRKSSKRHTLKTDASFRFERGVDPMGVRFAGQRAALLILELAGGHIEGKTSIFCQEPVRRKEVELDYDRIRRFIGKDIDSATIDTILEYLGYDFLRKDPDAEGVTVSALVAVPSYMVDVYRECDVVEEILRIYGYNNVELPSNVRMSVNTMPKPDPETVRNGLSDFLAANGFVEIMNNSLTRSDYYSKLKTFPEEACVRILNPLSSDLNVMRQTLIPGGLEVIAYNINRQMTSLKTF
ncbi:phenylalanyl-tRNA synthetase beta subunit [gut metagenome]|uniref:phenylalanine--tRNA ligase n=1 Tax=gut metagenome TaxID=749906 RepID=J9GLX5_9ZZZZ